MKALRLEFVPASAARGWHACTFGTRLALLAGAALCVAAAGAVTASQRDMAAVSGDRALLEAPPGPSRAIVAGRAIPDAEANAVNAAVVRLNMPWPDVFDAIEHATPDSVALLSIEPDPRQEVVRIVAEVGAVDDMLKYVQRLKQQPFLVDVFLVHHEVDAQDANLPLRFQVEAHWVAAP